MTTVTFRLGLHLTPSLEDPTSVCFATYDLADPYAVELDFGGSRPKWYFAWQMLDRRHAAPPVPGQDVVTDWDDGVMRLRLIGKSKTGERHDLDLYIAADDPELCMLINVMNTLQAQVDHRKIDSELDAELAVIVAGIDTAE